MEINNIIAQVTSAIEQRSKLQREKYLSKIRAIAKRPNSRSTMSCSNIAHAFASCDIADQNKAAEDKTSVIGIVTAYNDMLSAHSPLALYPDKIKLSAEKYGAIARVAGGVPAMCDGITQGEPGMELSLFSRDIIAQSTAIALSHNVFDGAICMGVCDKIVPGLVIGALTFGYMPIMFVPAGPMPSGITNDQKAETRKKYAAGLVGKPELLKSEQAAYHSPGTCTFYGTANTNQFLMEIMGFQLASSAFTPPDDPLRDALTDRSVYALTKLIEQKKLIGEMITAKSWVNAIVTLMATGGSTNLTIHLIAMARAGGYIVTWEDMDKISDIVPLLTKIYPNGTKDVNHFHQAGGIAAVSAELIENGLLHKDVETNMMGINEEYNLTSYGKIAKLSNANDVSWVENKPDIDREIISTINKPFSKNGGLICMSGNIGNAIVKVSAVPKDEQYIKAEARVFGDQEEVQQAFKNDELNMDVVVVVINQGPKANGMPELHALNAPLSVIKSRGHNVALITDGRMSGASGRILSVIHVTSEAKSGGEIGNIKDGDIITIDCENKKFNYEQSTNRKSDVNKGTKDNLIADGKGQSLDLGRELFSSFREKVCQADKGAHIFGEDL